MSDSTRDIQRRMASVKNTRQITKAMEMVSAAKMRKSQEVALSARPYALKALEILKNVSGRVEDFKHPLMETRPEEKIAIVLISTDKGLCGGLNSNVFKKVSEYAGEKMSGKSLNYITIGKKARDWAKRIGVEMVAEFDGFGDKVDIVEIIPVARMLLNDFKAKKYDRVIFVYTNFISTLNQEPIIRTLLPINKEILENVVKEILPESGKYSEKEEAVSSDVAAGDYVFEPSPEKVMNELLPNLIETQVYHMVLEANASEHSARMVAMKNASEAADDMLYDLALSFNKARQAAITQEIAEISAGRAALEQ